MAEGPWTKWGVVFTAGALVIAYSGTASQLHWYPFHNAAQITAPPASSPTPTTAATSPSPSPSPTVSASSLFTSSPQASFLSVTPVQVNACECSYEYQVKIDFTALQNGYATVDWWTVWSTSGLDTGGDGRVTTSSLNYYNDTWTGVINVTIPSQAASMKWQWHTNFAVYAPGGAELAHDP